MLTEPGFVSQLDVVGAPINYKWNSDLALEFFVAKDQNVKLYKAIDQVTFRAVMALGIAVSECVVWRYKGLTDITDALNRIEAAWAASFDPSYAHNLQMRLTKDDDQEIVAAPLDMTLKVLEMIDSSYRKGSVYLAEPVVKQAVVAKYLLPNGTKFSDWVSETLKRLLAVFPRTVEYNLASATYDPSGESPVPRDFFSAGFEYSKTRAQEAWKKFLANLRSAENPYLSSSQVPSS